MPDDRTIFQGAKPQGSLSPGVRLNGMFEIERLIAAGGMGEVYKGVAIASGDAVAIKLVRPDLARDPDVMALFKREAAILHDLLHDAIVRYYVFSLEPELQRYYIAMEFVDGVSLQRRLTEGPLTPEQARILLRRIGGALETAHERGVVHRDISSDNIILPGGDVRRAKIVDFGIARAARAGEGTILGGGFAGKYKYVSPEQLGLYGGEVTPRSDIYSFGLVLAEALRGEPLDMGGTQVEVVDKRRAAPDLSGVEPTLRPLLTAMLAPNPNDRPQSMAEVAAWGEGATQARPAPAGTVAAPARRSRAALAAAALVLLAAVLGVAAYALRDRLAPTQTAVVTTPSPTFSPPPLGPTPSATPTFASPMLTPTPSPTQTQVVTATDLLEQMPPKPERTQTTLPPATVGSAYRAPLPAFSDPAGKGLTLHATPEPPAGLAVTDLGGGRSELAGEPKAAGNATFDVVAVTAAGKSARTKIELSVRAKAAPPQPAQSAVTLETAFVGAPYSAGLPPFRSDEPLTLRADAGAPEGLQLEDLGHGLSQLAGDPKTPGAYAFDVVATSASGVEARMKVRLDVAPAPKASPSVSATPVEVKAETPGVSGADFLRDYPATGCFVAHARDDDPAGHAVTLLGADPAVFEQFGAAFRAAVKAEPELHGLVVRPSQCPAVDFLQAATSSAKGAPRLVLDSALVGKTHPLSGTLLGLSGRAALVLVVDDGGAVFRLRAQTSADGASATFVAHFSGDPSSVDKPQMVIAVASDRPLAADEKIDGAPSAQLMPKLVAQARAAGASAAFALFKFEP